MVTVVVEREFEVPQVFEELQAVEDANSWCLETHVVTFQRSYFALDGKRMVCVYQAPDAEAVRKAQDQAGLPYLRIYQATVL